MRTILVSIALFLSMQIAFAQEKYSSIKIHLNDTITMPYLQELGLEVDHGEYKKNTWFKSDFSARDIQLLRNHNIKFDVLIDDVSRFYAERNKVSVPKKNEKKLRGGNCKPTHAGYTTPSGFSYGNMGGYFTYQEAINKLDSLAILYPNLITVKQPIGNYTTQNGNNIFWLKISDNPNQNESEPQLLYTSIHHAREALSLSQLIYYMYYLCENYNSNSFVKYLVDNIEMYFVPLVNPDGYQHNYQTNPNGGGMWRKNRKVNGGGTFGVDLNRNYGLGWGFNNTGSSPNSNSDTYRGTAGFSEPETQAMRDFCNSHQFKFAMNYHTYSNLLVYPWGYLAKNCDDSVSFREYANDLTKYNAYKYGTDLETVGYSTNGSSDDWMYGETVSKPFMFAMTPEVGNSNDGFWPAINRIIPLCEESNYMNLKVAEYVLKYATLEDITPRLANSSNGFIYYNIRQLGLDTPASFTVNIQALSPFVTSVGGPKTYSNLPLILATKDSISYTLNSNVPNNTTLRFALAVNNGSYIYSDTVDVYYGNVQPILNDACSNFTAWDNSGWNLDNTSFVSPGSSFAENTSGNYSSNSYKTLTNVTAFNLTDALRAELMYKAKWELENSYDYVRLAASEDNGLSWTTLCTPHTQITANQNLGTDEVYTGVTSSWVNEIVNLDAYAGKSILIRWEFESDGGLNMQGFNMDDIVVQKLVKTGLNVNALSEQNTVSIYPNPASTFFTMEPTLGFQGSYTLYTIDGKQVRSSNLTSKTQLDISSIQNGMYLLEIKNQAQETMLRKKITILKY
jgi:hypothetical protein